jgi:hypothetical protein
VLLAIMQDPQGMLVLEKYLPDLVRMPDVNEFAEYINTRETKTGRRALRSPPRNFLTSSILLPASCCQHPAGSYLLPMSFSRPSPEIFWLTCGLP